MLYVIKSRADHSQGHTTSGKAPLTVRAGVGDAGTARAATSAGDAGLAAGALRIVAAAGARPRRRCGGRYRCGWPAADDLDGHATALPALTAAAAILHGRAGRPGKLAAPGRHAAEELAGIEKIGARAAEAGPDAAVLGDPDAACAQGTARIVVPFRRIAGDVRPRGLRPSGPGREECEQGQQQQRRRTR